VKISGVATVHAPAARVWTALADPAVLLAALPGCERLEPTGLGSYHVAVRARVASVEGSYTGEVSVSQQQEPRSFALTVNGAGAPGAVSASVQVRLAETAGGSTELGYDADAVIGGLIAGVGQRMFCSVARRLADEFVGSLDEVLAGRARADAGLVSLAATPVPATPVHTQVPDTQVPATQVPDTQVPAALAPVPDTQVPAAFARGVLVGAAGALVGVALAGLIGRRGG
jgi:uncharacterized protein